MKKIILAIIALAGLCFSSNAQTLSIPDANFKAYLVGNTAINTNGDSEIQMTEAMSFTGLINCVNQNISDLTGIAAFSSITQLRCNGNNLTSLNVSSNTALVELTCDENNLTRLDLSHNTALKWFTCNSNSFDSLDLSNNTELVLIYCNNNNLTHLNVANGYNTNITHFDCEDNPNLSCVQVDNATWSTSNWTKIDAGASFNIDCGPCVVDIPDANFKAYLVSNAAINTNGDAEIQCEEASAYTGYISCNSMNISDLTGIEAFTEIWSLSCYSNSLTSLDVSQNTKLTTLKCNANSIESLDLRKNMALQHLECNHNQLTFLDLSKNSQLTWMYSYSNPLTNMNLANGSNTNLTYFNTTYCPNLTCIQVDDVSWSTVNWTPAGQHMDATASFSTDCNLPCTIDIPDANFKAYLVGNTSINTNGDAEIQCDEASAYTGMISCQSRNISDLTGIEAFTSLTVLRCYFNSISNLDVSSNTALTELNCGSNNLTSINTSKNVLLKKLSAGYNSITSLDLTANTALEELYIDDNSLQSLDLSKNLNLKVVYCSYCSLSSLGISGLSSLKELYAEGNELSSLDLSHCSALTFFDAYENSLTDLRLDNGNNQNITWFNVSDNPNLTCIQVDDVDYSNSNWTNKDASASFSEDCSIDPYLEIRGLGGVKVITVQSGTLQMEALKQPNNTLTTAVWRVEDVTGSATIDENSGLLTAVSNGEVTVSAQSMDDNDLYNSVTVTISGQSVSGVRDLISSNSIEVYPNPATSQIIIDDISVIEATITNINGEVVLSSEENIIDISALSAGSYLLKIDTHEGPRYSRFVKK